MREYERGRNAGENFLRAEFPFLIEYNGWHMIIIVRCLLRTASEASFLLTTSEEGSQLSKQDK
jgi:hypothetical protein